MLVLARRPGQKILFPGLGIAVEVLRQQGNVTRLGIEAPHDVVIMRDEVASATANDRPQQRPPSALPTSEELRQKTNLLMTKLQQLQQRLDSGTADEPEERLTELLSQLAEMERQTNDVVVKSTPPRVLLVEDQDNERELLATCLRLGGIDVMTAANGREAFDRLHDAELPDLVLLDMRMPDVDGPTLLKQIRDDIRLHSLRVFAVSGSSRSEFGSNPLPLDGWFSKPVRIDALLQAVRNEHSPAAVS